MPNKVLEYGDMKLIKQLSGRSRLTSKDVYVFILRICDNYNSQFSKQYLTYNSLENIAIQCPRMKVNIENYTATIMYGWIDKQDDISSVLAKVFIEKDNNDRNLTKIMDYITNSKNMITCKYVNPYYTSTCSICHKEMYTNKCHHSPGIMYGDEYCQGIIDISEDQVKHSSMYVILDDMYDAYLHEDINLINKMIKESGIINSENNTTHYVDQDDEGIIHTVIENNFGKMYIVLSLYKTRYNVYIEIDGVCPIVNYNNIISNMIGTTQFLTNLRFHKITIVDKNME